MIRGHGGEIFRLADRLGCLPEDIVDMSSNVNPLGPMPELTAHLQESMACIRRLPEVDASGVRRRYAQSLGVDADWVAAGYGTTELIYLLRRALNWHRVLVLGPTYADYADACRQAGVRVDVQVSGPENGFVHDLRFPDHRLAVYDVVFICNPNNPTGTLVPPDELVRVCREHPDTLFVIDESYLPFAEPADSMSQQMLDNAVVLHSLSKIHTLPGLRIGFATGHPDRIRRIQDLVNPWAMNGLAQTAVDFVLANGDLTRRFTETSKVFLDRERRVMGTRLARCNGLRVMDSHASFLLMTSEPLTAGSICEAMAAKRFLIRDCSNFYGLGDRYFRISLKTETINGQCADALAGILEGK